MWDWKKWDLDVFTTAVDEQLRESGLDDGESFTQVYQSFCISELAAA